MLMLSDSNYLAVVNQGVVVVDFMADWCQPCKAVNEALLSLAKASAEAYKDVMFAKVNVDYAPNMAVVYGVNSIPTVIVLVDGAPTTTLVGSKCTLANIKKALSLT